jgi:hypothetical protein
MLGDLLVGQAPVHVQQQEVSLAPRQPIDGRPQIFRGARAREGILWFVIGRNLQLIQPALLMRHPNAATLAPSVHDIRRHTKQISLRILDENLIAITQQPHKDLLR